eukprot:gene14320-20304_t
MSRRTTPLVALLLDDKLQLENAGDCRAEVSDDGEARVLTRDHRAAGSARATAASAGPSVDEGFYRYI